MRLKLHDKLAARLNRGQGDAAHNAAHKLSLRAYHGDQESLKILAQAVETSTNSTVVKYAIFGIGLLGQRAQPAIDILISALSSTEPEIRREAVESLGKSGAKAAVPALEAIIDDPDDGVHSEAIHSLYEITGDRNYLNRERPNLKNRTKIRRAAYDDPIYREPTMIFIGGFPNERISQVKKSKPEANDGQK